MTVQQTNQNKQPAVRELTLDKNGKQWVFRYEVGREVDFFRGLIAQAEDPNSDFDWFDAARLSHQMGQAIRHRMSK